jgi:RHS repeat-associated protein
LMSLAPGNQLTTNTWDGENRLTITALPSGIVDSFTYNGDGLRVQKIDSTGTTKHVWDGQNILLETNASNIVQVVYTLEPLSYGNLISQSRSGSDSFYLFDALGSTRQLSSSTSLVTDTYLYDCFGNILSGGTSGSTVNPFLYVGRVGYYRDADPGTYYLRARVYDPSEGRFRSRDRSRPGQRVDYASIYLISENNPIRFVDPMGHESVPPPGGGPSCSVSLVCARLIVGAIHCGVEISDSLGNGIFHIAQPGFAIPNKCIFGSPNRPRPWGNPNWWTEYSWVSGSSVSSRAADPGTCACIRATAAAINAANNPYAPVPGNESCASGSPTCNSNYASKCLLKNCGLDISNIWGPGSGSITTWTGAPFGWNHRMQQCTRSFLTSICGCVCLNWQTVDQSWCGN